MHFEYIWVYVCVALKIINYFHKILNSVKFCKVNELGKKYSYVDDECHRKIFAFVYISKINFN